ncbi:DMT family transporter [Pseudomonas aeruginosa]
MARNSHAPASSQAGFLVTLFASTFLMGSSFVAGKILLQQGFTPMILVGWRFFVAALATLPLVLAGERNIVAALLPAKAGLRDVALVILIGLLQTAAVMGLLFWAMQVISASTAAILLFTNPIWVAVLGRIFLGESLHRARLVGLLLGVVGVALAIGISPSMFSGGMTLAGEIIGIVSALCWASATLINKRAALPLSSWALSFWQMLVGAIAILTIAYLDGEQWPSSVTREQWAWFLWLSIPASTGSFGLWFVALKRGGATRTSGFLFLAPLFTVILAYFILDTAISWMQAAGGVLIGLALWLVNRELPARNDREKIDEVIAEGEP